MRRATCAVTYRLFDTRLHYRINLLRLQAESPAVASPYRLPKTASEEDDDKAAGVAEITLEIQRHGFAVEGDLFEPFSFFTPSLPEAS